MEKQTKKRNDWIYVIAVSVIAGFVMGWFWGAFYTQYSIQQQEDSHSPTHQADKQECVLSPAPPEDACLCYLGENSTIIMEHGGEYGSK
jgi:hypothetical protein